jgi:hypothetical protein
MPTDQHAQSPDEPEPPPCDCAGCSDFRAIHAGFSLELAWHERATKRDEDRAQQRHLEEHATGQPAALRWAV